MTSAQRLQNRVAVISGAARGIGAAIAGAFAQHGAHVVIADIDAEEGDAAVAAIRDNGGRAISHETDIADDASVASLASAVGAKFGRCDILVNNAGILDMTGIDAMSMERFQQVCNVNVAGYVRSTKALLPWMRKAGPVRRIVNIASIMGLRGFQDSLAYSTAKGAVVNFTRALAADLAADGILVNAIAPGFIDTRMAVLPNGAGHEHQTDWFRDIYIKYGRIPMRRAGTPEDIAGPALFFASEDSRYVTGQILLVDGGVSSTF